MGIGFVRFNRRANRRSLAIFRRKKITHLGALNIANFARSGKNHRRNRRETRDFGALSTKTKDKKKSREKKKKLEDV